MHTHPTLDNLYLGNINPNEDLKPAHTEYKMLNEEAARLIGQMQSKLAPEDQELFHAMHNACGGVYAMEVREAFIMGFRLGANIMIETLGTFVSNNDKV